MNHGSSGPMWRCGGSSCFYSDYFHHIPYISYMSIWDICVFFVNVYSELFRHFFSQTCCSDVFVGRFSAWNIFSTKVGSDMFSDIVLKWNLMYSWCLFVCPFILNVCSGTIFDICSPDPTSSLRWEFLLTHVLHELWHFTFSSVLLRGIHIFSIYILRCMFFAGFFNICCDLYPDIFFEISAWDFSVVHVLTWRLFVLQRAQKWGKHLGKWKYFMLFNLGLLEGNSWVYFVWNLVFLHTFMLIRPPDNLTGERLSSRTVYTDKRTLEAHAWCEFKKCSGFELSRWLWPSKS